MISHRVTVDWRLYTWLSVQALDAIGVSLIPGLRKNNHFNRKFIACFIPCTCKCTNLANVYTILNYTVTEASCMLQLSHSFKNVVQGHCALLLAPYYCAENAFTNVISKCSTAPGLLDIPMLVNTTRTAEQRRDIDSTDGLRGDKVMLISGKLDLHVRQGQCIETRPVWTMGFCLICTLYRNYGETIWLLYEFCQWFWFQYCQNVWHCSTTCHGLFNIFAFSFYEPIIMIRNFWA